MADRDDTLYRRTACAGAPVDLFFPDPTRPDAQRLEQARAICADCPVREACLAAGMAEEHGIWGGLTPRERRVLRRKQRGEAA
ncbi:MAG: WhiB family transcriptional regulator [Actinomycetota bacterium]|jgi:WhiB family redox-sensing transcriptional regulator|nr:WhiB family transcriptional regulator [Actinomycetota bacterium]